VVAALSLDTNVLVDMLRAQSPVVRQRYDDAYLAGVPMVLSAVAVHELASGAAAVGASLRQRVLLDQMLADLTVVEFTLEDAERSGILNARLKSSGLPIGDIDTLIAGQALARGWTVVTRNVRHFGRVVGLPLIDWTVGSEPLSSEVIAGRLKAPE
jgi:tRNA(fMet)-specific endonuclease VapC